MSNTNATAKKYDISPDKSGYFGSYGGQVLPPHLKAIFDEIADFYNSIKDTPEFKNELKYYAKHYVGRPSPIYFAEKLSIEEAPNKKGAKIYLKREDLNHTGAHKINHTIGEVLVAKKMGRKKVIAETGAGQHGVALATAAALLGMPCEIHMGDVDIEKQAPNVTRMRILGAKVIPVTSGTRTLKDAVDSAINAFAQDPKNIFFAIGSVVGPHPFPMMIRDFQRIIGEEAREQFHELTGGIGPNHLVACVGGGSNAMGLFSAFLEDADVQIHAVEPGGRGMRDGDHAATLKLGRPGNIHGMHTYLLQDATGEPSPVYSIASGLDYPGVGPQHSFLKDSGRVSVETIGDSECLDAFMKLSQLEGIIPALESAHAVAYATKLARELNASGHADETILVNLSGRGDKDIDFVVERLQI